MKHAPFSLGAAAWLLLTVNAGQAPARTTDAIFNIMHSFCAGTTCKKGQQGSTEPAPLLQYGPDRFIGTAEYGGANLQGVIYEVDRTSSGYKYSVLHSFCAKTNCADGAWPADTLVIDQHGNIYGTTMWGGAGANNYDCSYRHCGTAYELIADPTRTTFQFKLLYSFCKGQSTCSNGALPRGLTYAGAASGEPYDGTSPLYGASWGGIQGSYSGCSYGCGTIFALVPPDGVVRKFWSVQTVYSFCSAGSSCRDGAAPNPGLLMDPDGIIYGTTMWGGKNGGGAIFKIDSSYSETTLFNFPQPYTADPFSPAGFLAKDDSGNFYGTAGGGSAGGGTLFELKRRAGGDYRLATLYSFCSQTNCADGSVPRTGVSMDSFGLLYGTTVSGGPYPNDGGVIFRYSPRKSLETVLHSFCVGCTDDGLQPISPLIFDDTGHLLGATASGGTDDGGTAYEIAP